MHVIVGAAGVIDDNDPLRVLAPLRTPKALVSIAGKPMIQWVLEALEGATSVGSVVVVGLSPDSGLTCKGKPLWFIPSQGTIVHNAAAGAKALMQRDPRCRRAFWIAGDLPLVRPEMIEWFVTQALATRHQLLAGVVPASLMDTAFPGAGRTFFRLDGRRVCPCDIYTGQTALAHGFDPTWYELSKARKSIFHQVRLVGFLPLVMLLLGCLTEARLARFVARRLGPRCGIIQVPYPELAMDVDKPGQYEIAERVLLERRRLADIHLGGEAEEVFAW